MSLQLFQLMILLPALLAGIPLSQLRGTPIADEIDSGPGPYWLDIRRSCGPVCLTFLDKYYGGSCEYRKIAEQCPPGPEGTALAELKHVAEQLGYYTLPFEGTAKQLTRLRYPAILHFQYLQQTKAGRSRQSNHFVVLLGWDEETQEFNLFNPPTALSMVPYDDVAVPFSGVGLIISDTPLPTLNDICEPNTLWRLLALIWGVGLLLILLARNNWRPRRLATLMMVSACGLVGCEQPYSGVEVQLEPEYQFDAGEVLEGTLIKHTFQVVNTGDKALHFKKLIGQCTCNHRLLGQQPLIVESGQSVKVEVEVPSRRIHGYIEKIFLVVTDASDPKLQRIPLKITAQVLQPINAVPSQLHFGVVFPGKTITKKMDVLVHEPGLIETFQSVKSDVPGLAVSLVRQTPGVITIGFQLAGDLPNGDLAGKVTLRFKHERYDEFTFPVVGRIQSDFEVIPRRVLLHSTTGGNQRLRVRSISDKRFRILETTAPSGFVVTFDKNTSPNSEQFLSIAKAKTTLTPRQGLISVRTDHPQQEVLQVPVDDGAIAQD